MKKLVAFIAFMLLLLTMTFAAVAESISIAIIYPDTVDDKGWCQTMDEGVKKAIAQGYEIDYTPVESVAETDVPNVLDQLAGNYDIIIAHKVGYQTALTEIAQEYPDQVFALGSTDKILGDNVFSYIPHSEETGYLNGIIAGMTTKANKVGIVGPADAGDSARYVRGFIKALQEVNPDCEYMLSWTGSFSDTVGAGDIGKTFIAAGCDVLVGPAQQSLGALRIVDSSENVLWIAQTATQMSDFPNVVMAAADYDYSAVIISLIENVKAGKMGGECTALNYNNHGFTYAFSENADLMPEDVKAAVETAIEALTAAPNTVDFASVELK